ncbi:hypothetical protein VP01_390g3 [Puccinia sorghi]|uniref:Uncharacterized protein n=1 Tax=Puccinia sorghi TaxID=27349 RepID=A0A0L6USM5_9BASI|nr:hypothetical protein VP01_390g3 [Puccinia sorghi]
MGVQIQSKHPELREMDSIRKTNPTRAMLGRLRQLCVLCDLRFLKIVLVNYYFFQNFWRSGNLGLKPWKAVEGSNVTTSTLPAAVQVTCWIVPTTGRKHLFCHESFGENWFRSSLTRSHPPGGRAQSTPYVKGYGMQDLNLQHISTCKKRELYRRRDGRSGDDAAERRSREGKTGRRSARGYGGCAVRGLRSKAETGVLQGMKISGELGVRELAGAGGRAGVLYLSIHPLTNKSKEKGVNRESRFRIIKKAVTRECLLLGLKKDTHLSRSFTQLNQRALNTHQRRTLSYLLSWFFFPQIGGLIGKLFFLFHCWMTSIAGKEVEPVMGLPTSSWRMEQWEE